MDIRIPSFNSLLDEIKVEDQMDGMEAYQDMIHQSWDSGVVMDSNTVLQMAEFQEVVDNLQKGLPPPPPYHFHVPPSFKGVVQQMRKVQLKPEIFPFLEIQLIVGDWFKLDGSSGSNILSQSTFFEF